MYRDEVVFVTFLVVFFALLIGLLAWMTKGRAEDILECRKLGGELIHVNGSNICAKIEVLKYE